MPMGSVIDRRRLLLGAIAAVGLPNSPAWAETSAAACTWPPQDWIEHKNFPSRRWVKIVFVHTNERFNQLYMEDGKYVVPAVQKFPGPVGIFEKTPGQGLNPILLNFF